MKDLNITAGLNVTPDQHATLWPGATPRQMESLWLNDGQPMSGPYPVSIIPPDFRYREFDISAHGNTIHGMVWTIIPSNFNPAYNTFEFVETDWQGGNAAPKGVIDNAYGQNTASRHLREQFPGWFAQHAPETVG